MPAAAMARQPAPVAYSRWSAEAGAMPGGEFGAAERRELVGVQASGQSVDRRRLENARAFLGSEGDALAERVHGVR